MISCNIRPLGLVLWALLAAPSTAGAAGAASQPAASQVAQDTDAAPRPDSAASTPTASQAAADGRLLYYTVGIGFGLKNLSAGVSARYLDYAQTTLSTDVLLTSLLTGLAHDDLTALRLSGSQLVAARLSLKPPGLAPWHGAKQLAAPYPDIAIGVAGHCVLELDSLTQALRLGSPGVYLGMSLGPFVSFIFESVSVALHFRPLGKTFYFLDGDWETTDFQVRNATLDVVLSYTLPW